MNRGVLQARPRFGGSICFLIGLVGCQGEVVGDVEPGDQPPSMTGSEGGAMSQTGTPTGGTGGASGGRGGQPGPGAQPSAGGAPSLGSGGAGSGGGGMGGVASTGGMGGMPSGAGGMPVEPTPTGKPTFVAVGYAGRRVRSTDLGKTWTDDQQLGGGGDDQFLMRSVSYGAGRFVAAGWKIMSSTDGKTWTEHKNPQNQWLGGMRWGNTRFVAAGGYGYSAYSLDGIAWTAGKGRATEAARSLAFGMGKFMAATDDGNWWSSTDGNNWVKGEGGHSSRIVFCDPAFSEASACKLPIGRNEGRTAFGAGVWVSVSGSGFERSENGTTWTKVSVGGASLEAVTFGYSQ